MWETVSEKIEKKSDEEIYLIWQWFKKIKNKFIEELKAELNSEKNIDKKLLIKEYISKIKLLNSEIITFSSKKSSINGETSLKNNIAYKITIFNKNLTYQNQAWLDILLYHEFQHYIWRDKQLGMEKRELNAKILSFRYYLIYNDYDLSILWFSKLFKKIKKEIDSNKSHWKYNRLSQSEEVELFWIYERFKDSKEDLLFYLENLVKLEDLKKDIRFA